MRVILSKSLRAKLPETIKNFKDFRGIPPFWETSGGKKYVKSMQRLRKGSDNGQQRKPLQKKNKKNVQS